MGERRYCSTMALVGGEWSDSRPSRFNSRKTPPPNWIGGWVGPRFCLDAVEKSKISWPYRESYPDRPDRSPSLNRLSCPGSFIQSNIKFFRQHLLQARTPNFIEIRSVLSEMKLMNYKVVLLPVIFMHFACNCSIINK
jgi:hypothetical protein